LQGFLPPKAPTQKSKRQLLPNPCPVEVWLLTKENPAFAGLLSGRPDLNRGPHRPELWAKFSVVVRNTWKSHGLVVAASPLGFADLAVDSRGLGSEIELLPNGDLADGARLVGTSWFCRRAVARAAAQVRNRRVITLAAGQIS
jgi:hypothetical protein